MEREYKLTFDRTTTYYVRDAQGTTLATYTEKSGDLRLSEQHLYGAKRLGMRSSNLLVATTNNLENVQDDNSAEKRYELTNHLGNVLAVVSGEKKGSSAQILSLTDYYPFGMEMDGRKYVKDGNYRYGFQGQEKENEYTNFSSHYAFEYRINDTRLGRFLSVDPLSSKYPYWSPYAFSGNQVINMIELEGLEPKECGKQEGEYQIATVSGTNDYYGWRWSGKDWSKGSSTSYNDFRDPMKDTKNDLTKDLTPDYLGYLKEHKTEPTEISEKDWLRMFKLCYIGGSSSMSRKYKSEVDYFAAVREARYLFDSFCSAKYREGDVFSFSNKSAMSKIMSMNKDFKDFAKSFEDIAMDYFRSKGSLEGFDGSQALAKVENGSIYFGHYKPSKSKEFNPYLLTVMGGTKGVSAVIKKIDKNFIKVEYKIWDHYGAGWDDTDTVFPGLAEMSYLQHFIPNKYQPFVWNITVNRKRSFKDGK